MAKRLTVTYNDAILYDSDVLTLTRTDDDEQVTVTGRTEPKPSLSEMFTSARRDQRRFKQIEQCDGPV